MTRTATQLITEPVETPGADRVRSHTDPEQLSELDREAAQRVASFVGADRAGRSSMSKDELVEAIRSKRPARRAS